jgi:hypothetical protein
MPGLVRGNFASYAKGAKQEKNVGDEEVTDQAVEQMFSMCGNAGQEALIGDLAGDFYDWALEVLEVELSNRGTTWGDFRQMLLEWYGGREDKVQGTEDIWSEGWQIIAEQSGYHDTKDEYGEGTGDPFGI